MKRHLTRFAAMLALLVPGISLSQGVVYLVIGSDTGIWEGLDVSHYQCTYLPGLYSDPTRNAARVMDPAFRSGLVDSYGTPMKLTWWIMAGNVFRYATNTNVPYPNTLTFYLMMKYHGPAIRQWGDEVTLHYHSWVWTDYDGDGKWWWNQAKTFEETADDFNETLAEILLNEEMFPVSFRSGWHAMDNSWQHRLDQVLPYSLHNDYPAKRTQTAEPIDNVFDWSRAPSTWIPFHPSPADYQVPGSGPGWNVRSKYMASADSAFMAKIFAEAAKGIDQVVCLWAHLPETDFPDNIRKVDSSAHRVAPLYPAVKFRYCTAVEAMQAWRHTADTTRPTITVEESVEGTGVRWAVHSNEPLFQPEPVVAVKDRYEQYRLLPCVRLGDQSWETAETIPLQDVAKVGVAATDTSGNCALTFLRLLPDEIFVDDEDTSRVSSTGLWTTSQTAAWGRTSRIATLHTGEEASFAWTPAIVQSALYNVFVQVPATTNPARNRVFRFRNGGTVIDSVVVDQPLTPGNWVYLGTRLLGPADQHSLEMASSGTGQDGLQLAADVVKYSPLIRDKWLVSPANFDAGEIIVLETNHRSMVLQNQGVQPVTISGFSSMQGFTALKDSLPISFPPMGTLSLNVELQPSGAGPFLDTLVITSDDPHHPQSRIVVIAIAKEYFTTVDDRDSLDYFETGAWNFSNAHAYGTTSRFAYPAANVTATFVARPKKAGLYDVQSIVPTTVNATPRARYLFFIDGVGVDSVSLDQNSGSGTWVQLVQHMLPANAEAKVVISDAQTSPISGRVLRADAIRFQWVQDGPADVAGDPSRPATYGLAQNYPNPFNPTTVVSYHLPAVSEVRLTVYDLLGREVAILVNEKRPAGRYTVRFDASALASGVYIYRMVAGPFVQTRKMILLH